MNNLIKMLLLCGTISLVGCATVPKQPKSFAQLGQFQAIPLNNATYRVSFKADDDDLSYGTAEELTLLKAAQVTVQQQFDFFKVINDPSNQLNQKKARRVTVYNNRPYYPYYRYYGPFWHDPFYDMPYSVYADPVEIAYSIQVFKKDQAPHDAFDAHRILQSLGGKYGLAADGSALPPQAPAPKAPPQP
jgi:hypothetical protein